MHIYIYHNGMKLAILDASVALVSSDKQDAEAETCPLPIAVDADELLSLILGSGTLLSLVLGPGGAWLLLRRTSVHPLLTSLDPLFPHQIVATKKV